jgi:hypothetical protein
MQGLMSTPTTRQVALVVMLIGLALAPPVSAQQTHTFPGFAPRLDFGLVDLGVSVAPRRPGASLAPARETSTSLARLADTGIVTTDIGLDLRVRWPSAPRAGEPAPLQPYVSLGPALAVPVGDEALTVGRHPAPAEPAAALGVRGALGLTWQLWPDASLFGEYRIAPDRGGARTTGDADFFYGLNIRF